MARGLHGFKTLHATLAGVNKDVASDDEDLADLGDDLAKEIMADYLTGAPWACAFFMFL